MFRNISELHDNTERILVLLDGTAETSDRQPGIVEKSAT